MFGKQKDRNKFLAGREIWGKANRFRTLRDSFSLLCFPVLIMNFLIASQCYQTLKWKTHGNFNMLMRKTKVLISLKQTKELLIPVKDQPKTIQSSICHRINNRTQCF